jgi:hypothetical protein
VRRPLRLGLHVLRLVNLVLVQPQRSGYLDHLRRHHGLEPGQHGGDCLLRGWRLGGRGLGLALGYWLRLDGRLGHGFGLGGSAGGGDHLLDARLQRRVALDPLHLRINLGLELACVAGVACPHAHTGPAGEHRSAAGLTGYESKHRVIFLHGISNSSCTH